MIKFVLILYAMLTDDIQNFKIDFSTRKTW